MKKKKVTAMNRENQNFQPGQLVLYRNGDSFELGLVKSIRQDGTPFVYYSEGDTAAATPVENLHRLRNPYVVRQALFGGSQVALRNGRAVPMDEPGWHEDVAVAHKVLRNGAILVSAAARNASTGDVRCWSSVYKCGKSQWAQHFANRAVLKAMELGTPISVSIAVEDGCYPDGPLDLRSCGLLLHVAERGTFAHERHADGLYRKCREALDADPN